MIRIYDHSPIVDIEASTDLDTALKVMENLDEIYKKRSLEKKDYISIHKRVLYFSTLYVVSNKINENSILVLQSVIEYWDKFSNIEQEELLNKISSFVKEEKIVDKILSSWLKNKIVNF
jgi:hypothetical protein